VAKLEVVCVSLIPRLPSSFLLHSAVN